MDGPRDVERLERPPTVGASVARERPLPCEPPERAKGAQTLDLLVGKPVAAARGAWAVDGRGAPWATLHARREDVVPARSLRAR